MQSTLQEPSVSSEGRGLQNMSSDPILLKTQESVSMDTARGGRRLCLFTNL